MTRDQFLKASSPIRLDAFENYIRGVLATSELQKVHYFREAVKLNPNYTLAMLQLGKTYYNNHEYESAAVLVHPHSQDRSDAPEKPISCSGCRSSIAATSIKPLPHSATSLPACR